jgi:hypothetical protein
VVVNIDELILEGFAHSDRYRIGASIERELGRLLAAEGLPDLLQVAGEMPRVDGGSFAVPQNSKAEAAGARIAQSVYHGMRNSR